MAVGTLINYTGLDPIISTIAGSNVELTYTGGAETIAVSDATGGKTTVSSTQGESVTFVNPTNMLKLTANNGADTVNVNSLAGDYAAVQIAGDSTDDVVNVNGPVALTLNNSFTVANVGAFNLTSAGANTGGITTIGSGIISLMANSMSFASTSNLTTGGGSSVLLSTTTPGQAINLGGADNASATGFNQCRIELHFYRLDRAGGSGRAQRRADGFLRDQRSFECAISMGRCRREHFECQCGSDQRRAFIATGLDNANLNADISAGAESSAMPRW